jgi:SagB-type dehydrogenase family enzyme
LNTGSNKQVFELSNIIQLPEPQKTSGVSLESAILNRRTRRDFIEKDLDLALLGQLLWAAQGITHPEGLRTVPSAGALYPLDLYLATRTILGRYDPEGHSILVVQQGDFRGRITEAALNQDFIVRAACSFLLTSQPLKTSSRYGPDRSPRYIALEAGHAAQNLLLQACARGLCGVPVGAFVDDQIAMIFGLAPTQEPLYLLCIGWSAKLIP